MKPSKILQKILKKLKNFGWYFLNFGLGFSFSIIICIAIILLAAYYASYGFQWIY